MNSIKREPEKKYFLIPHSLLAPLQFSIFSYLRPK
jgi:hypothetical protein